MKRLNLYITESLNNILDKDSLEELKELNTLSVDELKKVFSVLNYKEDSKEAKEILNNLPELVINLLNKYKYATTPKKYYTGIRALFNRIKIENYVGKKLNASKDINKVKQVSHYIDRNDKYDFTSSIGNIDLKVHFFNNKNFTITKSEQKNKADWFCFANIDLSDVTKTTDNFNNAKLYLDNKKEFVNSINTQAIGHTELDDKGDYYSISLKTVEKYAKYII